MLGMLLLVLIQWATSRIAIRLERNKANSTGTKGFLDYKVQAENGILRLTPKLNEISQIISNVGCSIGRHTKRVQDASTSPARIQLRIVRKTANMIDGYTRQLDRRGENLETIVESLAEGIEEWLKWISRQPNSGAAKQELEPLLQPFAQVMEETLRSTNTYIATVEAIHGISRDMNDAVDRHLISIKRIRDTNERMRRSCLKGLRHFDAMASSK
jgi:hypothetical protein